MTASWTLWATLPSWRPSGISTARDETIFRSPVKLRCVFSRTKKAYHRQMKKSSIHKHHKQSFSTFSSRHTIFDPLLLSILKGRLFSARIAGPSSAILTEPYFRNRTGQIQGESAHVLALHVVPGEIMCGVLVAHCVPAEAKRPVWPHLSSGICQDCGSDGSGVVGSTGVVVGRGVLRNRHQGRGRPRCRGRPGGDPRGFSYCRTSSAVVGMGSRSIQRSGA